MIGVPDHEESWMDDQVYIHRSDDEAIANYSRARRLQEDGCLVGSLLVIKTVSKDTQI